MPANVARTATYSLTNSLLPYLLEIAQKGVKQTLRDNIGLSRGVCTYDGKCTNDVIAKRFGIESFDLQELLA